jgi:hypothetical protein
VFKVDGGSYTEDAGGEPSPLSKLFDFKPEKREMSFSHDAGRLYRVLAEEVKRTNYEDVLNKQPAENPKEEAYDFSKEFCF